MSRLQSGVTHGLNLLGEVLEHRAAERRDNMDYVLGRIAPSLTTPQDSTPLHDLRSLRESAHVFQPSPRQQTAIDVLVALQESREAKRDNTNPFKGNTR